MTETIKSVSRRRTLVLAGAVTTVAGAALIIAACLITARGKRAAIAHVEPGTA